MKPEQAVRQSLIHTISRVALAAVFIYHGLIPKLLTRNVDEIAMVGNAGLAAGGADSVVTAVGILEGSSRRSCLLLGTAQVLHPAVPSRGQLAAVS